MTNFWQGLDAFNAQEPERLDVEFKLYYDECGSPLFYTTENEKGNYIVVDQKTYSQGDYVNIKVKNGKILRKCPSDSKKLIKSDKEGVRCHRSDVSIIDDTNHGQYWKLKLYEYH